MLTAIMTVYTCMLYIAYDTVTQSRDLTAVNAGAAVTGPGRLFSGALDEQSAAEPGQPICVH